MEIANIDLVNHVWAECINSHDGKALFHGNTLVKKFMGKDADWIDAFCMLRSQPELKVSAFYIDGLVEKIFEVQIPKVYTSKEYKALAASLALRDLKAIKDKSASIAPASEEKAVFDQMPEEEVREYKKKFFGNLMDNLK